MDTELPKPHKGRPKTIKREHILDVAMHAYWHEGIEKVSLNSICRKAKISKPGLYREIGNEDRLMQAVLMRYHHKVLSPLLQMLNGAVHFQKTLEHLIKFVTTKPENDEQPLGCLAVKMNESKRHLGKLTQQQIIMTQAHIITVYTNWIEHAKTKGQFTANIPSNFAAIYLHTQLSNGLSQMVRGDKSTTVKKILDTAFLVFS